MPNPSPVLIITVTKIEALAIFEAFSAEPAQARRVIGDKTYYHLGLHAGINVWMTQSETGTAMPGGALVTVRQAIQDLAPQAMILCGTAYGLRPQDQRLGDILIARQLQCYEAQTLMPERGPIARGDRVTSAERLLDRCRAADLEWAGPAVHFGLVLSGEKAVEAPAFRDWLLQVEPEAIGGEMEGAGLYVAAREAKIDWMVIKAISNWADGKTAPQDQALAADHAARFAFHTLALGGWDQQEAVSDAQLLAQMRLAAQGWDQNGRKPADLWSGERSTALAQVLTRLRPELNEIERLFVRPEPAHLLDELNAPETSHARRAQIGDRLAELGDPRPGVGLRADGLPDLDWRRVQSAVPVFAYSKMTPAPGAVQVRIEGGGEVPVKPFYIARYPITYVQYLAFLDAADGFYQVKWWQGLGASEHQRLKPGGQHHKKPNHPAETVSWYDATAFCRWLSARLGFEIRLPNEAEWQLAATGNKPGWTYPWGPEWHAEDANTAASHLNRTTAVGMYPRGAAPCGALDLAGNVCEWTTSAGDEPNQFVLRGGAWYLTPSAARTSARLYSFANERNSHFGFRVACTQPVDQPNK